MSKGNSLFDLSGRVAIVTGGYGVLGYGMAQSLSYAGARVAILGRNKTAAEEKARNLSDAMVLVADVLDETQLKTAREDVLDRWGHIDILVNAAGGNVARARTDNISIFGLPLDAFDEVVRLNLHGSVLPSLIFGEVMAKHGKGSIVNISSMASIQVLSGILGYSVAKAAIDTFTKWMAVDLAQRHGEGLRVNAIAPGFFITKQNRNVMLNPDGSYSERSQAILQQTPMGRFGRPEELQGTLLWLCSDASSFVTGTIIPVDGGFSVNSNV